MSLENWLTNRWLKLEPTSANEIAGLLAKIDRDIADAQVREITADWRLAMAYNACLGCATAALRCSGYRIADDAGHHYRTIESLRFTVNSGAELLNMLQAVRKKRNLITYDSAGTVSETEVAEVLQTARDLRDFLVKWIGSSHPHLAL